MNFIDSLWNSRARILFRGSRFKPSIKWYKSYVEKNRENPQVVVFLLLLAPKTIVALSNCLENYFVKVSRNTLFVSNYGTRASKLRGENVSYVGTIAHLLFALSTSETNERPSQPRQNSQNMNTDEMALSTSPRLPTIHPPLGLDIGKQGWLQIWY